MQRKAALATVVRVKGSSYRRPGARMLITDDSRWEGAISGGCLEGDGLRLARQVIRAGSPVVVTYDTMDDDASSFGVGLGCNGIVDILIEPIGPADAQNPVEVLGDFVQQRDVRVLATVLSSDGECDWRPGQRFVFSAQGAKPAPRWLQADMDEMLAGGRPLTHVYQTKSGFTEVFIERIDPGIELVISAVHLQASKSRAQIELARLFGRLIILVQFTGETATQLKTVCEMAG